MSYWEKRQEQKYLAGEKKINDYYLGLKKSFEQAKREIQVVINDFYMRYARENQLSYAEAQRALSKTEIGDLKSFINKVNANMGKYDLELNNMSIKARITRYEALQKQIDALLQQLYSVDYQYDGEELLKDVYSDSYYRTWFNIDQYHGFHQEFAQVNPDTIDELIRYPFNGADFSTRIWKQKDHMLQVLNESITTMLIQGRNPNTLAKDFAKKFNTKEYEAYRLLHTEGSFIIEQSTQKAYENDGVLKYQWLATLDSKTCEECVPLDGKVFDVGKGIVGKNLTPKHNLCRCTTIPYYDDVEPGTRTARGTDNKQSYSVPADMTFEKWHKEYVENNPEALLAEKKARNFKADKKQYEKYKDVLGSGAGKSIDDFQNLKYNKTEEWASIKGDYRKLNAYNKIIANEPAITKDLTEIANNTGSELAGLEFKLKTKESYMRKINMDSKNSLDPTAIQETIDNTNDVIRYTFQASHENLVDKYIEINKQLTEKGYSQTKVKNTWLIKSNPYKGINCNYSIPGGQKFEIQYHTPESFAVKNGEMHRLYEEWRVLPKDSDKRIELEVSMKKLSDSMIQPDNIERVK